MTNHIHFLVLKICPEQLDDLTDEQIGVYVNRLDGSVRFRWVRLLTSQELTQLAQTIARRVSRFLPACRGSGQG